MFTWHSTILVHDLPSFPASGLDGHALHPLAGQVHGGRDPGTYGSQYARLLHLDDRWLAVYTIYDNHGYIHDQRGGTRLQIAQSLDEGRSWTALTMLQEPGRDLDNGQLTRLPTGDLLLACRSVRWQHSYQLPVYRSADDGRTWSAIGSIDAGDDSPGFPDKGVYEPHLLVLADGRVAAMYANERHVVDTPSYSQVISERISPDGGATWGPELWVAAEPGGGARRPGMPVWTRLRDGRYIVVYEVVDEASADVYCKISDDGITWPAGLGVRIPDQAGGPYVAALSSGLLVVTSNSDQLSYSRDDGARWVTSTAPAWMFGPEVGLGGIWSSVYEFGEGVVGVVTSAPRIGGGNNIQIRVGTLDSAAWNGAGT